MDVMELDRLAYWFLDRYPELNRLYTRLLAPINHNASQPNKQPVEDELEALLIYLRSTSFETLSLQQLRVLADLEADQYIGQVGAAFIEGIVRTANYDPATAAGRLNTAIAKLNEINSGFLQYRTGLHALKIEAVDDTADQESIIIRIGFQKDASIDNVTDWRESAKDWYEIIRGLALASGEAPEDTKIIGASTGSIILILAGTLSVTTLLAMISGRVTSVAKDTLGILNAIEDLRHKRVLNKNIEQDLRKQEQGLKDAALADIVDLIKQKLPNLDGEQITAIEGSVKKLLVFNEKGGNVDFVAPEHDDEHDDEAAEDAGVPMSTLAEARKAINEYQAVREQLKLLTDGSAAA